MTAQTVKLNLDTTQFDRGMARVQGSFGGLTKIIAGAAAALGAVSVGKGFLNTAREFENLGVQLKFLTGSAQEGAKALEIVDKAAASSSFSLNDMAQAAPLLLTVADSTEQLNELLSMTGDLAAVSGLSFVEAAGQLQRAFAGGIGAADLFREKGLKAMLGFQEGVQYSAQETKEIILTQFRDQTTSIVGASAEMAKTFDGVMSMMGDKYNRFQRIVMNSAVFDNIKAAAMLMEQAIEKNFGSLEEAGRKFGNSLVDATKQLIMGTASIMDAMTPVFEFIKRGVNGVIRFANQLPPEAQILGLIGFILVGRGVKLILIAVAALFDEIKAAMDKVVKFFEDKLNSMIDAYNKVKTFFGGEPLDKVVFGDGAFSSMVDEVNKKFVDFIDNVTGDIKEIAFETTGLETNNEYRKAAEKLLGTLDDLVKKNKELVEEEKKRDEERKKIVKATGIDQKEQEKLQKQREQLEKQFEQIRDSIRSEQEAEEQGYAQKIKILQQYYGEHFRHIEEYNRIEQALYQKHQAKLADINKRSNESITQSILKGTFDIKDMEGKSAKDRIDIAKGVGSEVLGVLAQNNKKAFELQKALAVAQALLDAKSIIMSFARFGSTFGPIGAALGAAAGVAFTAAQIAAIQAQQYTGRKYGGSVQKGQPYIVGEGGKPEMFVPNQTGTIIPNNKLGTSGPVNVNFNIQALDSTDVDTVLLNRRGLITGMIREAMEENGMRSLV